MATKLFTRSFLIIMFINFLLHLSFSMITPSLPIYFENVGIGSSMAGFCVAAFTIGSIFVRPIAGNIIDHLSRRKIFFYQHDPSMSHYLWLFAFSKCYFSAVFMYCAWI